MYSTINKGDMVYYARIQKKNGIYDMRELKVRTVGEDYFCGMDKKDRHVYLLLSLTPPKIIDISIHTDNVKIAEEIFNNISELKETE